MQTASAKERAETTRMGLLEWACLLPGEQKDMDDFIRDLNLALAAARLEGAEEVYACHADDEWAVVDRLRAELDKFNKETKP